MTDNLFNFDESLSDGFNTNQQKNNYEEKLKKARVLCIRGLYEKALAICEEILDEDVENMGAYIEILRVHTKDFNIFEGEQIEQDIYAIEKLFPDIDNEEYIDYLQKRLKVVTQKSTQSTQTTTATTPTTQESTNNDNKTKTSTAKKTTAKKSTAKKTENSSSNDQSMTKKKALHIFGQSFQYSEKEVDEAFAFLNNLCDNGDGDVACTLGLRFKRSDIKKAIAYLKKGADFGHKGCIYQLAHCYIDGEGVKKDEKMAFNYYKLLTEKKFSSAFLNLGECFYAGKGVAKDEKKAFETWKAGDLAGDLSSTFRVGWCYRFGVGVAKSYSDAAIYYRKSAKSGNPYAKTALREMGYNDYM